MRLGLLGALLLAGLASLVLGSRLIGLADVLPALWHRGAPDINHIVWQLRLPRTILAIRAGASLAIAGAISQSWTRNGLADPGFIGITSGAAFAIAIASLLHLDALRVVAAMLGAGIAAAIVLLVTRRSHNPIDLIVVGVGVSAVLGSGATILGLYSVDVLDAMRHWTVGSTFGRGYADIAIAGIGLALGAILAALAAKPLDLLAMGEETSRALGSSPAQARALAAAAVIVLAGTATAAVGPVAFVGFAAPHLIRLLTGPSLSAMLLPTALAGALMVLLADVLGRLLLRPGEVEMSIVLAFFGAPLLIVTVMRRKVSL